MTTRINGLTLLDDGRFQDEQGRVFNPHRTQNPRVLEAQGLLQAQRMKDIMGQPKGGQSAGMSEVNRLLELDRKEEALTEFQQVMPQLLAVRNRILNDIGQDLDDGLLTPEQRHDEIMRRARGVNGFDQTQSLINAGLQLMEEHPEFARFGQALQGLNLSGDQADGDPLDDFADKEEFEKMQQRLPGGTPEERRAAAEADPEFDVTRFEQLFSQRHRWENAQEKDTKEPEATPNAIDIPRPGPGQAGPNPGQGLTPEQRGFVQQEDGTFRPGSAIGGIPSLAVMQQLEANAAPERPAIPYRGEIVPDDERFRAQPEGMMRNAIGVPGGGTMVADVPMDRNGPRFGSFQNRDGTWTGMGASANQGGFATQEEANQWSMVNMAQPQGNQQSQLSPPNITNDEQPLQGTALTRFATGVADRFRTAAPDTAPGMLRDTVHTGSRVMNTITDTIDRATGSTGGWMQRFLTGQENTRRDRASSQLGDAIAGTIMAGHTPGPVQFRQTDEEMQAQLRGNMDRDRRLAQLPPPNPNAIVPPQPEGAGERTVDLYNMFTRGTDPGASPRPELNESGNAVLGTISRSANQRTVGQRQPLVAKEESKPSALDRILASSRVFAETRNFGSR